MDGEHGTVDLDKLRRDLATSLQLLQRLVPYDAVLVLRTGHGRRPSEICRTGYSSTTAWALAHMFPAVDTRRFTSEMSDCAPLPPTISTSGVGAGFTTSRLFREHLAAEGYAEGMSLVLHHDDGPVGMAHFSSRTAGAFDGNPRDAALAVSGLLGSIVAMFPGVEEPPRDDVHADVEQRLLADPDFVRHLREFCRSHLTSVDHLWDLDGTLVSVDVVQPGRVVARPAGAAATRGLTRRELQVLSALCCGAGDGEIASRLHLGRRTVESYLGSLRQKLGAASRLEAVVIALGAGLYVPHPDRAPLGQIVRGSSG
ncbi:helix-turn-helix transcriptional regulator [Corynebacterium sp. USCH3]|uniref:helix-turn-helix transcriptional regulator n=1 Tax=Corynebacterium sp. USCH3 TaxID=3024840 RepID=UPI0030993936